MLRQSGEVLGPHCDILSVERPKPADSAAPPAGEGDQAAAAAGSGCPFCSGSAAPAAGMSATFGPGLTARPTAVWTLPSISFAIAGFSRRYALTLLRPCPSRS